MTSLLSCPESVQGSRSDHGKHDADTDQSPIELRRLVGALPGSPFDVVARKVKTPEQERDELAEELRAMGKAGEAALKRVRGAR